MEGLGLAAYGSGSEEDDTNSLAGSPLAQVLKALDPSPSAKVEDVTAAAAEEVRNLPSAVAPVPQLDASPQLASATGPGEADLENGTVVAGLDLATPPPGICSKQVQAKVEEYLRMQRERGFAVKAVIGESRGYRNPYFLEKWVADAKILQGGSNFPRDIFDPSALHEEDFYDSQHRAYMAKQEQDQQRKSAASLSIKTRAAQQPALPGGSGSIQAIAASARAKAQEVVKRQQQSGRWG
mmetsp:Transcript_16780/g.50134  ORF Transcript_16780/g.50134 Transcript_16780/m.50134 type:complete len:239 (-) Transcript_16780:1518-2234(-)